MLTQDGKLVEIDKKLLASSGKKISNKELQNWIIKNIKPTTIMSCNCNKEEGCNSSNSQKRISSYRFTGNYGCCWM